MARDESTKRPSASQSPLPESAPKRQKRPYHHNHKLRHPVQPQLREPALLDDDSVARLIECSIGQILTKTGYEIAEPTALECMRQATEEYFLHLASYARQSMTASRRLQPIPQDFEFALQRTFIGTNGLTSYIKSLKSNRSPVTTLPSPPEEENELFDTFHEIPILSQELSGENDRRQTAYIPTHFPRFPSKHTYCFTPVFTERETDPRRIRELGMEDSRHGEEALRKLARAAFKDAHVAGTVKAEKRLWGRKTESAETMFEKTIRAIVKREQKAAAIDSQPPAVESQGATAGGGGGGRIGGSGLVTSTVQKENSKFSLADLDLAPIVNCERGFWRKTTSASTTQRTEKPPDERDPSAHAKVERWV